MRKETKFYLITFIIVFIIRAITIFSGEIVIGVAEWLPWSVYSIAESNGYFKDEGVNVRVKVYPSCYDNSLAFKNNLTDVFVDMLGTLYTFALENEDTRILFATNISDGGDKIVINPKIKNLFDDNNKNNILPEDIYTYSDNIAVVYYIDTFLKSKGYDKYEIYQFENDFLNSQFNDDNMNIIVSYEPYISSLKEKIIISSSKDFKNIMPEGIAIKKDAVSKDDIKKIMNAVFKAIDYIKLNKLKAYEEIRNLFPSYAGFTNKEFDDSFNDLKLLDKKSFFYYNEYELIDFTNNINVFFNKKYNKEELFKLYLDYSYFQELKK